MNPRITSKDLTRLAFVFAYVRQACGGVALHFSCGDNQQVGNCIHREQYVCSQILRYFAKATLDVEQICSIAIQVLSQKALCQQDPDQDENEEAPEDQAEYDSVLISSAGDLVAALSNALGSDFAQAFGTFFPLIAKYYVSNPATHLE